MLGVGYRVRTSRLASCSVSHNTVVFRKFEWNSLKAPSLNPFFLGQILVILMHAIWMKTKRDSRFRKVKIIIYLRTKNLGFLTCLGLNKLTKNGKRVLVYVNAKKYMSGQWSRFFCIVDMNMWTHISKLFLILVLTMKLASSQPLTGKLQMV